MRVDTDQPRAAAADTAPADGQEEPGGVIGEPAQQRLSRADEAAALLARHITGDPDAFARLVTLYRAPVYGYLVRSGVPPGDRDDLFQEIFIRVHRASASYERQRPLHPWLFTIVCNAVRTHQRRRRVREIVSGAAGADLRAGGADGQTIAEARETVSWLEREIPTLPAAQREVLLLVCVESLPLAEVAAALSMPLNTVKTHLRRARLALAERLAARAGGGETR